ncbi:unnamed protein product [Phytophthora lilii]|uniref:Unnamed protein product n=1 Tax=Phytophthora lilii TaxID=2077276 RepID=A0A9W6X8I0_9STRA|nr:unnamed protein product [Phytophthora lilii]
MARESFNSYPVNLSPFGTLAATGNPDGVQPARTSVPAARTAPSSSGLVDTSSSSAPADVGSSSPDGSSKLPSATAAVETRAVQVCSGSHGASNLASAESSSPAPPTSVVTREVLEELLVEASAESSERVIAVLGPCLEQLGRLAVGLQVAPSIRGDRRVRSRVDAAKSLEEVVNAAVPCMEVGGDVTLDLATMRGQLYSAEAAQAAAEKSLHQEIYRRENGEVLAKTAYGERDSLRAELRRSNEAEAQLIKKVEQLNAIVATHNEVYAKLAKQVQAAEDHAQRVSKPLAREQEVFKATVAANTAQCLRLHRLLASSDVADDSASARLRRRNEDLMERVQRLVKANRTLRARVQLEEMDPNVLVLISEGSLVMLVLLPSFVVNSPSILLSSGLSTGELDWEALGVSDDTRTILRQMYQSADKSNPDTLIADSLARVAFAEGDSLGETSSAARASKFRKTSPGTSAAEVHKDRSSRKKTIKSSERKRSREECALDRELESSSRRPRLAADAAGQRDVDDSRDPASSRGEAEDTEASVDLEFSSTSRSNVESRPSGFSKAKSKSRSPSSSKSSAWSASTQVSSSASEDTTPAPRTPSAACRTLDLSPPSTGSSAAGTRRSSRASAAQSSFKSLLMCELEDADDEDVLGGSSPPLARPRSSSRPIVIDDDSDDDSESSVKPARTAVLDNTLDSSVDNSRPVGSEVSAVPGSNVSGHSPAHEALASGARAPSDGSSAVPTSREVSVLPEVGSPPLAATRESESTASTALVVRDSSIPAPPSVKAGSIQKSAAKTQAKAKTSSQKKKRARSTKAQSESPVPAVASSESSAVARSSSSRSQSDPALTVSEISAGWDSDFRGPASPDLAQDASSATARLATSNDTLVAPSTENPDHLLFLAQVSAAAEIAGEDGGDASEGS